jgi:predicted flavoprotein YhiN
MEGEVGLELAMEEDSSKWFPRSNSAREVRDRLVAVVLDKGVDVHYNKRIVNLRRGRLYVLSLCTVNAC